tara:strand:- start:53704 stop:55107 length:1404 start_codon:yes stop_codon:yes gene_type:complete
MSDGDIFQTPKGEEEHHKYHTPIEKKLQGPLESFGDFIVNQITTSVLLVMFAIIAIIWASFDYFGDSYKVFQNYHLGITLGSYSPTISLKHFVNDFLMALFFFFLGLEVKREFIAGELGRSNVRNTVIFAALGGMIVPALIFVYLSPDQYDLKGWGVPIATDTAFALGVLALLKHRLPRSIFSFIAALAVIDDIGAITVLALFYTNPPDPFFILMATCALLTLLFINMVGIRKFVPYFLLGILTWFFVEKAGLHGTIAGVLVALTIPARPKTGPKRFIQKIEKLTSKLRKKEINQETTIVEDDEKQAIIEKVESLAIKSASPLSRLQHLIQPSIFIFVLPIFALTNTGIPVSLEKVHFAFEHSLAQNTFISLLAGKLIGISLFTWLICRFKVGVLPTGMKFGHVIGLSLLAGIGFTMSIFIAEMGFGQSPDIVYVKTGIFSASITAAVVGYVFLFLYSRKVNEITPD